jgi:hypothetical protein
VADHRLPVASDHDEFILSVIAGCHASASIDDPAFERTQTQQTQKAVANANINSS